jgi:hypothetical protein
MPVRLSAVLLCIVVIAFAAPVAFGAELLVNGNFETGTFAGWTVANLAGSTPGSNWFIDAPGSTTPFSGWAGHSCIAAILYRNSGLDGYFDL